MHNGLLTSTNGLLTIVQATGGETHLDKSVDDGGDNKPSPNNAPSDVVSLDNAQGIATMGHCPNIE